MLQIVSSNTFAEQLLKVPTLFTHFYHHAREHKEAGGFLDYLESHYSAANEKNSHTQTHSEEDNDCNLPFKHCGNCCTSMHSLAAGFVGSYLTADCIIFSLEPSDFLKEDDRIESLDLCTIWQPPKIS